MDRTVLEQTVTRTNILFDLYTKGKLGGVTTVARESMDSIVLSGKPTTPTPPLDSNDLQIANTEYINLLLETINAEDILQSPSYRFVTDTEKTFWNAKQPLLISGTSIKTINNQSILGSGNITITGGGGGSIVVDTTIINGSTNPVDGNAVFDALALKADISSLSSGLATKQNTLVSATNIKTINGNSLLGSGDITISGGGSITIDTVLTDGSANAIANNAVFDALALKQNNLVSGTTIKTLNGTSILGSGNISIPATIIDTILLDGSNNAISNNAVVDGLATKQAVGDYATNTALTTGLATKPSLVAGKVLLANLPDLTFPEFVESPTGTFTLDKATSPISASTKPITSGAVFTALQNVQTSGGVTFVTYATRAAIDSSVTTPRIIIITTDEENSNATTVNFMSGTTIYKITTTAGTLPFPPAPAPTALVVDDNADTLNWTYATGYTSPSLYEYSVNSGTSWTTASAKPIAIGNNAYAAGVVRLRTKASGGNSASSAVQTTTAFTVGLDDLTFTAGTNVTISNSGRTASIGNTGAPSGAFSVQRMTNVGSYIQFKPYEASIQNNFNSIQFMTEANLTSSFSNPVADHKFITLKINEGKVTHNIGAGGDLAVSTNDILRVVRSEYLGSETILLDKSTDGGATFTNVDGVTYDFDSVRIVLSFNNSSVGFIKSQGLTTPV